LAERRKRQRKNHAARFDILSRQQAVAFDRADGKARKIVIARIVEPRHLGGLSADQRAARLLATPRDAADDGRCHAKLKLAAGKVVEEEEGLGALHHNVVNVHRDEVDSDPIMAAGLDRELELGADPVGRRDKHGVGKSGSLEIEKAAEAAEAAERTGALCGRGKRADRLDQRVAGVDIDPGIAIGHFGLVLGSCGHRTTRGAR
jgi:hypothetical protein